MNPIETYVALRRAQNDLHAKIIEAWEAMTPEGQVAATKQLTADAEDKPSKSQRLAEQIRKTMGIPS